jgi:hypothetical protein
MAQNGGVGSRSRAKIQLGGGCLARKWMESETDIEILKLLGRFGPLTGKAVVAMVNFREESRVRYRLWYLGKMGYIRNRAYCEPAGKKNKVMKRGAVYYLSTAAVRYLRNKGMDVPDMRTPRVYELESRHRISETLAALCRQYPGLKILTMNEFRRDSLPRTVTANFIANKTAFYFPRLLPKGKKYNMTWTVDSIDKLRLMGVRYHVVVVPDRFNRYKLLQAFMKKPAMASVILPYEVDALRYLNSVNSAAVSRMEQVWGPIQVKPNWINTPALTIESRGAVYHAVDASTFSVRQLYSIQHFSTEYWSHHRKLADVLLVIVRDVESAREIAKLYPKKSKDFRFVGFQTPPKESFFWFVRDGVKYVDISKYL